MPVALQYLSEEKVGAAMIWADLWAWLAAVRAS